MTLRPRPTRWFELVTTRAHVADALHTLAETGAVELERRPDLQDGALAPDFDDLLATYRDLARRYGGHWPEPKVVGRPGDPRRRLEDAMRHVLAWRDEADPLIVRIEKLMTENDDLTALRTALEAAGDALPDPSKLAAAGPRLAAVLLRLPKSGMPRAADATMLLTSWETDEEHYVLAIGAPEATREIALQAPGLKGRVLTVPDWLSAAPRQGLAGVDARLTDTAAELAASRARLEALNRKHALDAALGDLALMDWLRQQAERLSGGARLIYVTGWTSASEEALRRAFEAAGVNCVVRLLPDPPGAIAPLVLDNPPWVRPFETFARMLGMPGRDEADPSLVVALAAPLLFGFMFGDVGQGAILLAAGLVYHRRYPMLRLLIAGGATAVVFGFLFGSFFCSEDVIPALWARPLERPTLLLATTLAGGAVILTLGLLLSAAQAFWRGEASLWRRRDAGLLFAYLAILAAAFWRPALWGALVGALWFVIGAALAERPTTFAGGARAVAELAERLIQLLVNTVSFARVGAFALAHAGLSAAVMGLAHAAGGLGFWLTLIAGNALILALEGVVVAIQTTRLLLFEFFIRFLEGRGRALAPLSPPRAAHAAAPSSFEPKRT